MQQRLIGAAALVPVVVIAFLLGQPWLTFFLAALAAGAAWETARLVRLAGLGSDAWFSAVMAAASVLGLSWSVHQGFSTVAAIATTLFFAFVVIGSAMLSLRKLPRDGFMTWVGTMAATFYPSLIALVAGILVVAQPLPPGPISERLDAGRAWLLVLVLTVWSLDSFAYLAGKYHGRGRFMNHVSPNKTWSGAIGGGIGAVVVCTALTVVIGAPALLGAVIGLTIAVVAQAGDLTESMIKRAAGEKDSGHLLPGHGGLLDRLDSFLFAGPAMFAILVVAQAWPFSTLQTVTLPLP